MPRRFREGEEQNLIRLSEEGSGSSSQSFCELVNVCRRPRAGGKRQKSRGGGAGEDSRPHRSIRSQHRSRCAARAG